MYSDPSGHMVMPTSMITAITSSIINENHSSHETQSKGSTKNRLSGGLINKCYGLSFKEGMKEGWNVEGVEAYNDLDRIITYGTLIEGGSTLYQNGLVIKTQKVSAFNGYSYFEMGQKGIDKGEYFKNFTSAWNTIFGTTQSTNDLNSLSQ